MPPVAEPERDERQIDVSERRRPHPGRAALRPASVVLIAAAAYALRDRLAEAGREASALGWSFLWVVPLFLAWSLAASMGWRVLLPPGRAHPNVWRLLVVRTEGAALSFILPSGGLAGDAARAALTRTEDGVRGALPAVVRDRVAGTAAELVVAGLGLAAFAFLFGAHTRAVAAGLVVLVILLGLLAAWRQVIGVAARILPRRRRDDVLRTLYSLPSGRDQRLWRSFGWHLVERGLMVAEIVVIAGLLGYSFGAAPALAASALATLFAVGLLWVPGQAGAPEAALALVFGLANLPPTAGLSVALVRRARQLVTVAAGLALLAWEDEGPLQK